MAMQSRVFFHYHCISCGARYDPDRFYFRCPACRGLLMVERDEERITWHIGEGREAQNFFDVIRFGTRQDQYPNGSGVFMWLSLLLPGFPVEAVVSLREGHTDLFEIPDWLKKEIRLPRLFIKMEGQLPSKSFKDRGMAVAVSDALRLQMMHSFSPAKKWKIMCASTGDTSAAAAMYAAYAQDRLECIVILPSGGVSEGQLFQARGYGATIVSVEDERGFDACMRLAEQYCAFHPETVMVNSENAMRVVGQESIFLEICQDLRWSAPDWISIPCGNGGNLTALMVSLLRQEKRGLIDHLPGIIVAQAERANTLVRWEQSGFTCYEPGVRSQTVASAMNIQDPVSFPRIKGMYESFQLNFQSIPEDDIIARRKQFMRAGADVCPQTAVAIDAVMRALDQGIVREDHTVVVIGTASGIKFPTKVQTKEAVITADLESMNAALAAMES